VTSPDARYKAALPEFPLFELDFGHEEAAAPAAPPAASRRPAHQVASPVVSAAAPVEILGPPALIELDAVEVDATPVVDEAEAALLDAVGVPDWAGAVGVFDLETTGIDTDTARIVSASVAVLDDCGVVVERKDWLLDPGVEIPEGASAVHGISTERARRYGRPAAEVVEEIIAAIRSVERRGIPLVVYNAPYDLTLLAREAARHGHEPLDGGGHVIDPLVIDKALDRYRKGKRTLEVTAAVYGVELTDAHDAAADAIAAGRLAQAMASRYAGALGVELARLHAMQAEWCREQAESFEAYMRRTKDPSFTADRSWPCR
jgi:DNA polymerase-3 subunit epsilon